MPSSRTSVHPVSVVHGAQNDSDWLTGSSTTEKKKCFPKKKTRAVQLKKSIYEILSNSMLTGIPQIMNAESIFRKLVKIVVFVFCTTGFFYQLWLFMEIYRGYPTIVDLQLKYPDHVELPSITVCNNNAIQKGIFCREELEWCDKSRNVFELCSRNRRYCLNTKVRRILSNMTEQLLPKKSAVNREYTLTREELLRYALPRENFIKAERENTGFFEKDVVGEYNTSDIFNTVVVEDNSGKRKLCYNMFGAVKTGRPVVLSIGDGFNDFYTSIYTLSFITLRFNKIELFQPDLEATAQIQIHSPFTYVNPYFGGFEISVSRVAAVFISVSERNLLPSPYDTNCTDYKRLWEENNNKGPLSREMCIEECALEETVRSCKCAKFSNLFPHSYEICLTEEEIACSGAISANYCNEQCKPPCRSVEYDVVVNKFDMEKGYAQDHVRFTYQYLGTTSLISLVIGRPEVMVYTHNAKHETIEAFGYLGGYIGIWLGISFIAVLDFAESVVLFLKNLFQSFVICKKRS